MLQPHNRPLSKGLSFVLGVGTALSLGLAIPSPASASPWPQLLLQGVQLYQLSHLSTPQKQQLGADMHQQVLQQYNLDTDPNVNAVVNRVGQRVAKSSDCPQYQFHFYVVNDPQINAFSTTGGYVYVNKGLLNVVDNEAQLAGVLGHEIGHICDNDVIHKIQQSDVAQSLFSATGLDRNTLANLGLQLAVNLPNSRQAEYNADAKGLKYITRAGYDPNAMVAFLRKLLNQSSPPAFLSDHPGTQQRIAVLQKKIAASH